MKATAKISSKELEINMEETLREDRDRSFTSPRVTAHPLSPEAQTWSRESIGTQANWVKAESGGNYPESTIYPNREKRKYRGETLW